MKSFDDTNVYENNPKRKLLVHTVLVEVIAAIREKGYNPVSQITGYLQTGNLIYIPRDGMAREKISKLSVEEIIEYLLERFIKEV